MVYDIIMHHLFPVHRYDDAMSLPECMDLGVAVTSPTETVGDKSMYHTTAGWINNTNPERKKDKYVHVVTGILDKFCWSVTNEMHRGCTQLNRCLQPLPHQLLQKVRVM